MERNAELLPLVGLMQNDVVQSVVHDMRTPMTIIKGYLHLLLSGGMGEMKSDQMELIQRSVGPLEDLIMLTDNLLQSVSLQKNDVELHLAPVDLDRLLKETIDFYRMPFEQRQMRIYRDGNTLGQTILVDAFWFKRILHNLVWNAFKFTDDGGTVSFHVKDKNNGLEISVQDTGRGIPAAQLNKIFQKFEQSAPQEDRKSGSGLGLWICHRVIALHGGQITVSSSIGHGSRFSIFIPPIKVL